MAKQDITYRLNLGLIVEGADGARSVLGDTGVTGTVRIPANAKGPWLESTDPKDLVVMLLTHLKTAVSEGNPVYTLLVKFAEDAQAIRSCEKQEEHHE